MDTLDSYLAREFVMTFLVVILSLALLFVGIDFFSNFWELKLSAIKILQLYLFKFPGAIHQFLPLGCLMASLLVVANMSRQNEILALYGGGVGPLRILSTFVAYVAIASTIAFVASEPLVPFFNKKQMLIKKGLDETQEHLLLPQHGGFWHRNGPIIYNVGQFIPETSTLDGLHVYFLGEDFQLKGRLHAKRALYSNGEWIAEDGFEAYLQGDSNFPVQTPFRQKKNVIPSTTKPSDFRTLRPDEDSMRLRDLRQTIQRNTAYGFDTTTHRVRYHERIAFVFAPIVLILLGLPLALRPLRTHPISKSIAFCFLAVFLYLLMMRFSISVGKAGHLPPMIAAWSPNMIFTAIAGFLLFGKT